MDRDSDKKLIHCSSCGADFDGRLVHCPYCGATNTAAAESAYMHSLRDVRRDLQDLRSLTRDETIAEAKEAGRFIRKVLVLIVLSAALIAGAAAYHAYREGQKEEETYIWMRDNIPILDTYYENRQYDELLRFYHASSDEDIPVWSWRHYQVFYYLEVRDLLDQILAEEKQGTVPDEDDLAWILLQELELLYAAEYAGLPEEDAAWIRGFAEPYLLDLQERFDLTEEETESFMQQAEEADGYLDYDKCRAFLAGRS